MNNYIQMTQKFETRSLFRRQCIEIDEQQVLITSEDLIFSKEIWIHKLNEINHRYEINTKDYANNGCVPLFFLFFLFALLIVTGTGIYLFLFVLTLFVIGLVSPNFFFRRTLLIIKTKGRPIQITLNRKNYNGGIKFANQLIQASKNYLKNKYGLVDEDLPTEMQFKNYLWLWQNDIIPEVEYTDLKKRLKDLLED